MPCLSATITLAWQASNKGLAVLLPRRQSLESSLTVTHLASVFLTLTPTLQDRNLDLGANTHSHDHSDLGIIGNCQGYPQLYSQNCGCRSQPDLPTSTFGKGSAILSSSDLQSSGQSTVTVGHGALRIHRATTISLTRCTSQKLWSQWESLYCRNYEGSIPWTMVGKEAGSPP